MEQKNKKLISIIVPVYNSKDTLTELSARIKKVLTKGKYFYELIMVDDGSTDGSWNILMSLRKDHRQIKIIQLNRNFGQHNALMCGFTHAIGDYIVTIDDDLQNPPEEIPKMYNKILENYDLVYGQYISKKHNSFRNSGSFFVQFIYKKIFQASGNLTSFRIIHKDIVKEILSYNRNYTFIDGLLAWHTSKIGYVDVRHDKRRKGKSGYTLGKLLRLSFNMLTNFSIFPLQLASIMGFLISAIGLFIAGYIIFKKILFGIPVTGYASIIVSIAIFSGTQLITIGLMGEYLGRIHLNINNKPQYIIRKKLQ